MKMGSIRVFFVTLVLVASSYAVPEHVARLTVKGGLEKDRESESNDRGNTSEKMELEYQRYELAIEISNLISEEDTFELSWYFIRAPLNKKGGKGAPVLAEKGADTITVGGRQKVVHEVTSGELSFSEVQQTKPDKRNRNQSISTKEIRGDVYEGYVVLLRHGSEIIDKKASDRDFLSDEWLQKLEQPVVKKTAPAPKKKSGEGNKNKNKKNKNK